MKINMSYETSKDTKSDSLPPTPIGKATKIGGPRKAATRRIPTKKSLSPLSQESSKVGEIGLVGSLGLSPQPPGNDIEIVIPKDRSQDALISSLLPQDDPVKSSASQTGEDSVLFIPTVPLPPNFGSPEEITSRPPSPRPSNKFTINNKSISQEELKKYLPPIIPESSNPEVKVIENHADLPLPDPLENPISDKIKLDVIKDPPPPSLDLPPSKEENHPNIFDIPVNPKKSEELNRYLEDISPPSNENPVEDFLGSSRITDIKEQEVPQPASSNKVSVTVPGTVSGTQKKKSSPDSSKSPEENPNLIDVSDNLSHLKDKSNQVQEVIPEQGKRKRIPMKRKILLTIDANSVAGQLDLYERKYLLMSADKKKIALRNLRNKFKTLQINYPDFDFDIPVTENPAFLHCCYDISVHQIDIQTNYSWWRDMCIIVFLGIEFIGTWFLKLKLSGFAENQVRQMNRYKRSLIEIAERQSFGVGSSWPPEARLVCLGLFNSVIFCLMNTFLSYFTPEIRNGIQSFLNDLVAPETKDKDYPNGLTGPSIVEMFGRMLGYGGNQEKAPDPKKAPRKPRHNS